METKIIRRIYLSIISFIFIIWASYIIYFYSTIDSKYSGFAKIAMTNSYSGRFLPSLIAILAIYLILLSPLYYKEIIKLAKNLFK